MDRRFAQMWEQTPKDENLPHWLTGGMCNCELISGQHTRYMCDKDREDMGVDGEDA